MGEGLRAGKGFFLVAPSIVTPQLLDGVLIQRLAGSRFAESLVETTLFFHPRPGHPFVSRRRKSPATEKGHGEEGSFCIRGYIYMYGEIIIVDDVVCVCLWIYIQGRGVVNLGNIYVLYCAKVSSSIFQTMYNLILLLNVLEGEKKEGRIVKLCMHESLKF